MPFFRFPVARSLALLAMGALGAMGADVVPGSGLVGIYFTDQGLSTVGAVHRGEDISRDYGGGSPDGAIPDDHYSARWLGWLVPPTTGTYTLTARADDGVRVWINGILVIDRWFDQSPTSWSATVDLVAGTPASLRYEFYENGGGAVAQLYWEGPGVPGQLIPLSSLALPIDTTPPPAPQGLVSTYATDRCVSLSWNPVTDDLQNGLYTVLRNGQEIGRTGGTSFVDRSVSGDTIYQYQVRSSDAVGNTGGTSNALSVSAPPASPVGIGTGLQGIYYTDGDLVHRAADRVDPKIDFWWGTGALIAGVSGRPASVRWQGQLVPRYSEQYTFTVSANSNARLFINDSLVIDGWGWLTSDATQTWASTVALSAQVPVKIRMEYLDRGGNAEAHLWWESWSEPKAIVPATQLTPTDIPPVDGNAVLGDGQSRTSPAWLEGNAGSEEAVVTATIDGQSVPVIRPGGTSWYVSTAAAGAPGIVLTPGLAKSVAITAALGAGSPTVVTKTVSWVTTSLDGANASTVIPVRVGDSLLFSTANGGALLVDSAFDGYFAARATGEAGASVPVGFPNAGSYTVVGKVGDAEIGRLTVLVVAVGLPNAVADQVGFTRQIDSTISPISAASLVTFVGSDQPRLGVAAGGVTGSGRSVAVLPLTSGTLALQARLGGAAGPLLASTIVDEFELTNTSKMGMNFIQIFPDGSLLAESNLILHPNVAGLEFRIQPFVSGCTFDDSTTYRSVLSNQFVQQSDGRGIYTYRLMLAPNGWYHLCHAVHVFQNGVQVSP